MFAENLGAVFGPSLMRSKNDEISALGSQVRLLSFGI